MPRGVLLCYRERSCSVPMRWSSASCQLFLAACLAPNDSNSDRHLKAQHRNESKRSTLLHNQTPNTDVYLKRRHRDVQVFKHLRDALTLAQYFPLVFQLLQNRFKSNKLQSRPLCAFSNSLSPSQNNICRRCCTDPDIHPWFQWGCFQGRSKDLRPLQDPRKRSQCRADEARRRRVGQCGRR
jgi:hypothetical protein